MTPATLTALAATLTDAADTGATHFTMSRATREALTQAAAILEQVAGADAGCPAICCMRNSVFDECDPVVTFDAAEAAGWRNQGISTHELIKRSDHLAALTAQSGEGVALYGALKSFVDEIIPNDPRDRLWVQARAAIAAYEAKRGGVR